MISRKFGVCVFLAAFPGALFAELNGPPIFRTGAPADGGRDCTACHITFRPANSDPRGRLAIGTGFYLPGVRQTVRVRIEHPEAMRWGFQLTARLASDETRVAGTFAPTDEIRVRCAPDGRDAPCGGDAEFASHRRASTRPGQAGGNTFEVEWTPPAAGVGEVVFYAGGNAANNNNAFSGDRIYTTSLRVSPCVFAAPPSLTSVVSGASFQPQIGPNAMITLFGSALGPPGLRREVSGGDLFDGNFPLELACVGVEIAGQRAPITYVSENQVNAQATTLPVTGPVEVRLIQAPGRPAEARAARAGVALQEYSPALFTFFSNGRNIAAQHANFEYLADPGLVPGARPAAPGDVVILYGTGFGFTTPVWFAGQAPNIPSPIRDPFTVTIGGVTLPPQDVPYAGLSPGSISGLYQFNVRIPAGADGDVSVVIEMGGQRTQPGLSIPVRQR